MSKQRLTDLTGLFRLSAKSDLSLSKKLSSISPRASGSYDPFFSTFIRHLLACLLKKSLRASLMIMLGLLLWITSDEFIVY